MPLLVDGHNLIGQVPGISLADADDEAQLVMLLRRYATAKRARQVFVVFDHGVYGHPEQLDGYGVSCYFARSPHDADQELIRRIRKVARPGEWTVVTSDRQIARAAHDRGVRVISSQAFAAQLTMPKPQAAPEEKPRDVKLSEGEIEEWLALFEQPKVEESPPLPEEPPKPKRKKRR
jgi:predicted RNA-binding protein with PIN domain